MSFIYEEEIRDLLTGMQSKKTVASRVFDGAEQDQGKLEDMQATIVRQGSTVVGLVRLLVRRGVITEDEAVETICDW